MPNSNVSGPESFIVDPTTRPGFRDYIPGNGQPDGHASRPPIRPKITNDEITTNAATSDFIPYKPPAPVEEKVEVAPPVDLPIEDAIKAIQEDPNLSARSKGQRIRKIKERAAK